MPTPIQYPLINGVRHGYSSIEIKINNQIYTAFKSINYSRKRSRTMLRGNSPDPLGKTRGTNEYSSDCEMALAEFNLMLSLLGPGYGDVIFQVTATYTESGFDTISDVLIGCTVDSTDVSQSEGTDPLYRKFDLLPLKILFNGVDDLQTPLTGVQT